MQWGILGAGKIAGKFAADLSKSDSQTLSAVGSRNASKADCFCQLHGGRPLASYQALLSDQEVDAVYISLPNSMHHEWTIRALRAGKHVLCEKPIATTVAEAKEMFAVAREAERVLIEAFMYRCRPVIEQLLQCVRQGVIGDVMLIRSHFTFQRAAEASNVRYQAGLCGGSLMDVGCYAINFSRAIASREPTAVHAIRHQHEFGVDDYAAGTLDFGGDLLAVFTCGMTVQSDRTTYIGGEDGYIQIVDPWFSSGRFDIVRDTGTETRSFPDERGVYQLEAETFAAVVAGERPAWITPEDSLGNMGVLERLL